MELDVKQNVVYNLNICMTDYGCCRRFAKCPGRWQRKQEPGVNIVDVLSFGWTFARKREF
jgi:hypothetical protein